MSLCRESELGLTKLYLLVTVGKLDVNTGFSGVSAIKMDEMKTQELVRTFSFLGLMTGKQYFRRVRPLLHYVRGV